MRLHFPSHEAPLPDGHRAYPCDIAIQAIRECQRNGTIAEHAGFLELGTKGRRGTGSALEVKLEAEIRDRGRRSGNSGSYGAKGDGTFSATFDEWGFFLAALYRAVPDMIVGSAKNPIYADAADFHDKTGRTYDAEYPNYVEFFGDDYSWAAGRATVGRRGYGRGFGAERYGKYLPRSADFLRQLHAGEVF